MSTAECPKKSPYVVELEPGTYWWCACGRSKKQPFCDGSHAGTDFTPEEKIRAVWLQANPDPAHV